MRKKIWWNICSGEYSTVLYKNFEKEIITFFVNGGREPQMSVSIHNALIQVDIKQMRFMCLSLFFIQTEHHASGNLFLAFMIIIASVDGEKSSMLRTIATIYGPRVTKWKTSEKHFIVMAQLQELNTSSDRYLKWYFMVS